MSDLSRIIKVRQFGDGHAAIVTVCGFASALEETLRGIESNFNNLGFYDDITYVVRRSTKGLWEITASSYRTTSNKKKKNKSENRRSN